MSVILAVNWEAVGAIGQVVGAVAVVISLIYLATEVRSNARETPLASMRSLSDAINISRHALRTPMWPSYGFGVSMTLIR